jgi:predicted nucleic acid-binding protein
VKQGATYDTGMLIALERRKRRALEIHERLSERRVRVSVPTPVISEWWRGRTDDRDDILRSIELDIGPPSRAAALLAGEALAIVHAKKNDDCRCRLLVDAFVMASAALRGDVVYTSDVDDLMLFSRRFPTVRLIAP